MYAIVDIETTGGHASSHGITEIAIHVHDGERVTQHFTTLINPERAVPSFITALTGITNAMLATAPLFEDVADKIFELLEGNVFVAHNVNFDYSFVLHHLRRCGYELKVKKLCTVRLARKTFPGLPSYSLGKLCNSLSIEINDRHRADGDATATQILFNMILDHGGQDHIDQMLKRNSADQWLPCQIDKEKIQALPPAPGVYYFADSKGKVIYVGKAINIRKRVTSHFAGYDDGFRRQRFLQQVRDIKFKECANELHALVLESAEIRKLWPRYNYAQKQPAQKYGLYSFEDNRGYIRLAIDKRKKHLPAIYQFNLLHEGKVLLRRMMEEFELHEKLCYLNPKAFNDDDVSYTDEPMQYNRKVTNALTSLEDQLPNFVLMDEGRSADEKLCFLIERGNFWGMGYVNSTAIPQQRDHWKDVLQPFADNDFIRNSIYNYAERWPEKRIVI